MRLSLPWHWKKKKVTCYQHERRSYPWQDKSCDQRRNKSRAYIIIHQIVSWLCWMDGWMLLFFCLTSFLLYRIRKRNDYRSHLLCSIINWFGIFLSPESPTKTILKFKVRTGQSMSFKIMRCNVNDFLTQAKEKRHLKRLCETHRDGRVIIQYNCEGLIMLIKLDIAWKNMESLFKRGSMMILRIFIFCLKQKWWAHLWKRATRVLILPSEMGVYAIMKNIRHKGTNCFNNGYLLTIVIWV